MEIISKLDDQQNLIITIKITPVERVCLKHDLPGDQGIVDWFSKGPSFEKIHRCKERMQNMWIPKLRDKGQTIPPDDVDLINMIKSDPDYLDREGRDAKN